MIASMSEKNSIRTIYDRQNKSEFPAHTIDYFINYLYYFFIWKQIVYSNAFLALED